MGNLAEVFGGVFGGVIAFIATRALVDGMDNSSWSTAEVTMMETILPLIIAMGTIFGVFKLFTAGRGR